MYALLRAIAGVALRWYYSDIRVVGADRIPARRPLLLVVNHPNALVDALLVGWVMPRRVLITAKATIFANPIAAILLRWLGVVPLRRAADERSTPSQDAVDASRNTQTFEAVHAALRAHGCVLIFPEGRSLDEPALLPLKTGAARMALSAHDAGDVPDLALLPIGLVFEQKQSPRTRVLVTVGEPLVVADWCGSQPDATRVDALTETIATRLRALTLNYASLDDAARAARLASLVATVLEDAPEIDVVHRGLDVETTVAREIDALSARLPFASAELRARADGIVRRIEDIDALASRYGLPLEDVRIELTTVPATRFALREGWRLLLAGPVAFWGWLNHWLPLRAARIVAMRNAESNADPAMRTIVAGTAFILIAYLGQTALVGAIFGRGIALAYLASLPLAAEVNFSLRDRMRRARRRARAFFIFRKHRDFHAHLESELSALRADVASLERELRGVSAR